MGMHFCSLPGDIATTSGKISYKVIPSATRHLADEAVIPTCEDGCNAFDNVKERVTNRK